LRPRLIAKVNMSPRAVPVPVQVSVPVQSVSQQPLFQSQAQGVHTTVQLLPPSAQTLPAAPVTSMPQGLLERIDGVVSEMERELSEDLAACVKSPLADLQRSGSQASVSVRNAAGNNGGEPAGDDESTIAWIDKQIWAIEHRREACENRQAHLADLRRMVSDGERGHVDRAGSTDGNWEGGEDFEEMAGANNPARRLSILEAEHDLLKKQVETEREDLLRVRNNLELECERRLREVRSLAEAVEDGKNRAWAAEEAANQRAKEARLEVQVLQESLREMEAVEEERAATGADIKQLEENSRAVLSDCRALQQRVRELEVERAAFLDLQAASEEEHRSLRNRIRHLEGENASYEAGLAQLSSPKASKETTLSRQREELAQKEAALEASHGSWRAATDVELDKLREAMHAKFKQDHRGLEEERDSHWQGREDAERRHSETCREMDRMLNDKVRVQADKEAEEQAREALEHQHQAVLEDSARLRTDKQKLLKDQAAEKDAKEEAQRLHQVALQDAEELRADQQKLQQDKEAEQLARQEAERKHAEVSKDMENLQADKQKLLADKEADQLARKVVEQKHAAVQQDLEKVRQDNERVKADHEAEKRLGQEIQQKHLQVTEDLEAEKADRQKLDGDSTREQKAKGDLERAHQAVLAEKASLHGDHTKLQALLEAEKKARAEAEARHRLVEDDKKRVENDHRKAEEDKASEKRARVEAEKKHQQLLSDSEKLRADQQKLQVDHQAEQQAREEAERKHAAVLRDMQQLSRDQEKLKADKDAEQRAREEAEKRHQAVAKDLEQVSSDQRKLRMDKEAEQRAKEEAERRHQAVAKDLSQVHADQGKLRSDKDVEQRGREEVERKHQAVVKDMERLKADHQEVISRQTATWEEEHGRLNSLHLEETKRMKAFHQEESEQIKSYHSQSRGADQKAFDEMQTRLREAESKKSHLEEDVVHLRKSKAEKEAAEKNLREAIAMERKEVQDLKRTLEDRDRQLEGFKRDQDHQLTRLMDELQKEQEEGQSIREELEKAHIAGLAIQEDAEDAMRKSDVTKQQLELAWREKLQQAEREIEALRRTGGGALEDANFKVERTSMSQRLSLWAEPSALRNIAKKDMLLPDSNDPFVQKVREIHEGVNGVLNDANEYHSESLDYLLDSAVENLEKAMPLRHGMRDVDRGQAFQLERRVEARWHDLKALLEDVYTEYQLSSEEQKKVTEWLDIDLHRCQEEIELLQKLHRDHSLSDVSDSLLEALLELKSSSGNATKEWESHSFSPAHWAAQNGRRDIIEFIRSQDDGHELIDRRDRDGRTPLFYADRAKKRGLVHYLKVDVGSTSRAFEPTESRPNVESQGKLSPAYQQVLTQIETQGWHSVRWKDDFTMLHWAATKGNKELCGYLVRLNADPGSKDNKDRTPADCARNAGFDSILSAIQEVAVPRASLRIGAFPIRPASTPTE